MRKSANYRKMDNGENLNNNQFEIFVVSYQSTFNEKLF